MNGRSLHGAAGTNSEASFIAKPSKAKASRNKTVICKFASPGNIITILHWLSEHGKPCLRGPSILTELAQTGERATITVAAVASRAELTLRTALPAQSDVI